MADLIKDTRGQWIVLSGLTISLSLIMVAILVSQAAINGYYSSNAALEFPKEKIRELTAQTRESARDSVGLAFALGNKTASDANGSVLSNFTKITGSYNTQVSKIYASHGDTINISIFKYNNTINDTYAYTDGNPNLFNASHAIENIWFNISYNDGKTYYLSSPEIIGVSP